MKIIDSLFKDQEDTNNYFSDVSNYVIGYLKTQIEDEELMNQIKDNSNSILIQLTDGKTYNILSDGKFRTYNFNIAASAEKLNMAIAVREKEVHILPGVALRPNFTSHQLVHELLHAMSSTQHNYFNEDGTLSTKVGTRVDYFNKDLKLIQMENSPSSDGLNEGVTEYLASVITNEYTVNIQVMLL